MSKYPYYAILTVFIMVLMRVAAASLGLRVIDSRERGKEGVHSGIVPGDLSHVE